MIELWPDKEAQQILKHHGDDPNKTYLFETGFGPSGKPHFGTFGEVVRTNYVMLAMRDRGYKAHLIAFSDDMDGLRKVPENFPAWLKDYIGKSVCDIPDPFDDGHESFSAHMNALLVQMLEELELDFEFRSSSVSYREGAFNEQLKIVIQNYEAVQDIVFPYLREETQENWFPFLPICENCGRVGNTRVASVDKEKLLVSYVCDREFGGKEGCAHQGTISPFNGTGKLQWKVDWPARWHAFGVNYEMFGKDLIESAEVGDRVVQKVFKGVPPTHMFYELFLDEFGRKISKSKGAGMNAEEWLRYGTYDSLMYLMLDKPREAKGLYAGVIPRYMEMTRQAAEAYYSGEEKRAREARHYQFIELFEPHADPPVLVDFDTLSNLVGNVGLSDPAIVETYLHHSNLIPETLTEDQRAGLHEVILKAKVFYDEQLRKAQELHLDAEDGFLLAQFVAFLEASEHEADRIHNELFETAKRNDVDPKKFFRALYNALIKQERGPRGGNFIKLLGQDTAVKLIRERVAESVKVKEIHISEEVASGAQAVTLPVSISAAVKERYPDLHIGAALIAGVHVEDDRSPELEAEIEGAIQAASQRDLAEVLSSGAIAAYRSLFQTFGANPNAMLPSPQNIFQLAFHDKRLPNVSNLVNATNLTVLETGISVAVYDVDNLDLPLVLRFAAKGDKHLPLGSKQWENVTEGELIYADSADVICRALNHRDSDKTKITTKTQNVLLIVDGSPGIGIEDLVRALRSNIERITRHADGTLLTSGILL